MKKPTITKSLLGVKGNSFKELKVEVHSLGFYLHLHENGNLVNTLPRSTLKKAQEFVEDYRHKLIKNKFTITEPNGHHTVIWNDKEKLFHTSL